MATKTFTVSVQWVSGSFRYFIDGVQQDTLDFVKGATYRFDQSDSSNNGHPLRLSTTSDGTHGGGVEYTTGVTVSGTPGTDGYTEIEVAGDAPSTLYYYCSVHGGMGSSINITADTWGALSWNAGQWGDQTDVTISLSGFSLTAEEGAGVGFPFPGWGALSWGAGNFGDVSDSTVLVSGNALAIAQGEESGASLQGWGRQEWGVQGWGVFGTAAPAGVEASFSLGTLSAVGEINAGWGRTEWGEQGWGIQSTLQIQGQQSNISQGDVTVDAEVNAGWGRLAWGNNNWGEQNLSQQVSLTGLGLTVDSGLRETWGTENWGSFEWGGISVTDVDVSVTADAVGGGLTVAEGTVDPSPDATVVGLGLSLALTTGAIAQGDANVIINNDLTPTFTAQADAQLSTAQAKFGVSSLLLDGTGDFVQSTASKVAENDFTVEFFAYASSFAQNAYLWDNQASNQGFAVSITSAGQLRLIKDNTIVGSTGSPGLINGAWNHIALVQDASFLNLYINGTNKVQFSTGGVSYPNQTYKIGANEGESQFFNGYIDEFRTSDITRYTTTFTPPTSAFTADGNTLSLLHFDGANGSTTITNSVSSDIPRIALGIGGGTAVAEAVTIASITGQSVGVGVRNAVAGASAEVDLTGSGLTLSVDSINVQSWQIVDTGSDVTWNIIDTAA